MLQIWKFVPNSRYWYLFSNICANSDTVKKHNILRNTKYILSSIKMLFKMIVCQ